MKRLDEAPGGSRRKVEEARMSLNVAIFLPGDHPPTPRAMELWNGNALSFFLEALYKGSTIFGGREFDMIIAGDEAEITGVIGVGTYKVVDQQLLIIREIGPLVGKIEEAWENMLQTVNTAAADVADDDEEEGELPGAPSDFLQR